MKYSNGRTSGITAPSISGQESLIYQAYRKAGLHPYDTSYVECHGTGTHVGDVAEVEALSRVFNGRTGLPLYIGSVSFFSTVLSIVHLFIGSYPSLNVL